ncbi:homocysteine S-methyltransferase [Terracoccus luteus]|uniref:Homocysteine S-methyltransferase n=1 Tax=Terracoccus luteus TaxID=53356 RepID=A0A495Y3C9_9MICO|nr:homocysteine S-methyltransferase family protein [Terracoccus luteus]RKT79583.1 homocysteine S-methyltransferase [Terracoccus luteus]
MPAWTVTDGGLETDLIFHHGVDLPHFAAYPMLESERGRRLLVDYYDGYAAVAARAGAGLRLETPTWRANPDWGARLGHDAAALAQADGDAVRLLAGLRESYRERYTGAIGDVTVVGTMGPRGDGYRSDGAVEPEEARRYHRPQVEALTAAGADSVAVYTLAEPGEAAGVVRAAREVGIRVEVSFTVETDGRLPDGTPVGEAIAALDESDPPDSYLVNCAHPTHVVPALAAGGVWLTRVTGLRCNASTRSHAELDEATELDEGDPVQFARDHGPLLAALPNVDVLGGCCGTDVRHVQALWDVVRPPEFTGTHRRTRRRRASGDGRRASTPASTWTPSAPVRGPGCSASRPRGVSTE